MPPQTKRRSIVAFIFDICFPLAALSDLLAMQRQRPHQQPAYHHHHHGHGHGHSAPPAAAHFGGTTAYPAPPPMPPPSIHHSVADASSICHQQHQPGLQQHVVPIPPAPVGVRPMSGSNINATSSPSTAPSTPSTATTTTVTSAAKQVRVFWDIENLPVPTTHDAEAVCHALKARCAQLGELVNVSAFGDPTILGTRIRTAFLQAGVELNACRVVHTEAGGKANKAEVSDKAIIEAVLTWCWDRERLREVGPRQTVVVLITADADFLSLYHKLVYRQVEAVFLTTRGSPLQRARCEIIPWEDILQDPTMAQMPTTASVSTSPPTATGELVLVDTSVGLLSTTTTTSPTGVRTRANSAESGSSASVSTTQAEATETGRAARMSSTGVVEDVKALLEVKGPLLGSKLPAEFTAMFGGRILKKELLAAGLGDKLSAVLELDGDVELNRQEGAVWYSLVDSSARSGESLESDSPDYGGSSGSGSGSGKKKKPRAAPRPPNYKTVLCTHFAKSRTCPWGSQCNFAHGPGELRKTSEKRGSTFTNSDGKSPKEQQQESSRAVTSAALGVNAPLPARRVRNAPLAAPTAVRPSVPTLAASVETWPAHLTHSQPQPQPQPPRGWLLPQLKLLVSRAGHVMESMLAQRFFATFHQTLPDAMAREQCYDLRALLSSIEQVRITPHPHQGSQDVLYSWVAADQAPPPLTLTQPASAQRPRQHIDNGSVSASGAALSSQQHAQPRPPVDEDMFVPGRDDTTTAAVAVTNDDSPRDHTRSVGVPLYLPLQGETGSSFASLGLAPAARQNINSKNNCETAKVLHESARHASRESTAQGVARVLQEGPSEDQLFEMALAAFPLPPSNMASTTDTSAANAVGTDSSPSAPGGVALQISEWCSSPQQEQHQQQQAA